MGGRALDVVRTVADHDRRRTRCRRVDAQLGKRIPDDVRLRRPHRTVRGRTGDRFLERRTEDTLEERVEPEPLRELPRVDLRLRRRDRETTARRLQRTENLGDAGEHRVRPHALRDEVRAVGADRVRHVGRREAVPGERLADGWADEAAQVVGRRHRKVVGLEGVDDRGDDPRG